jgi:predicted Zn-dependent peptidase
MRWENTGQDDEMKELLAVTLKTGIVWGAALAAAVPSAARLSLARPLAVQEHVLANGFRLLVVEDKSVPRVTASLWYRFGSMVEPQGEHGISHFLEHAIHQGTTTVGTSGLAAELPLLREIHDTEQKLLELRDRERSRLRERDVFYDELAWPTTPEMEALRRRLYELEDQDSSHRDFWAEYNAYHRWGSLARHEDPVPASTEQEYLEITLDLPTTNVELFFRIEADRMVNAVLRGWEAQRFTVFEQILNGLSRPETRFHHAIDGVTGLAHPVYQPDGGHPRDFAYFSRASMHRLYDDYFVPNNATLALVGDIDLPRARALAERYFGRVPRAAEPPARMDLESEPVPGGATRLDWAEPLAPTVVLRYRIPGVGHPDRPVLDTIAALMRGRHGLMGEKLKGPRALAAVSADFRVIHTYRFGSPGAINFVSDALRDEDLAAVEAAMLETIEELRAGRVPPDALGRARKALKLDWERIKTDRRRLGYEIGHFGVMDRWETLLAHMDRRQEASVADVQRVAGRYFVPANRVIATARRQP